MKKYIAVDTEDDTTKEKIIMTNVANEVSGILKTKDKDTDTEAQDIRQIFIKRSDIDGLQDIDVSSGEFTLEDVAERYNSLIHALRNGLSVVVAMLCFGLMGAQGDGKAPLGKLKSNQYVVTNEVDGIYASDMKNATYGIKAGYGSLVDVPNLLNRWQSIAIGPYTSTTDYFPDEPNKYFVGGGYSVDFSGPTVAFRNSVAIGAGAQARSQVSVAVGVRAMTAGLHGESDIRIPVKGNTKTITTVITNGAVKKVSTNYGTYDAGWDFDPARYESMPGGDKNYVFLSNVVEVVDAEQGITNIVEFYQDKISNGLLDPRCATADEIYMYDFVFNPGQPGINYKDAIYSVAMGYRALCASYHSLALGHYARTYRPSSIAAGPSTHVKSEGAVAFAYHSTIETNSPFSLAIGSRALIDPGMTNAIVIGVPQVNYAKRQASDYKENSSPHVYNSRPKAMKSNSINFVFNGDGLKDMFVDDVAMTDRLASEVKVVGNTPGNIGTSEEITTNINRIVGVPQNDSSIMFVSGSGVKIFTENYLNELEDIDEIEELTIGTDRRSLVNYGNTSQIEINGKKLSEILAECANDAFDQYHATVTNAAAVALGSITTNTNFQAVKETLKTFFQSIK